MVTAIKKPVMQKLGNGYNTTQIMNAKLGNGNKNNKI